MYEKGLYFSCKSRAGVVSFDAEPPMYIEGNIGSRACKQQVLPRGFVI